MKFQLSRWHEHIEGKVKCCFMFGKTGISGKFDTQKWGELSPTIIQNFLLQFLVNSSKQRKITRDKSIFLKDQYESICIFFRPGN